jgi:hypothetical protein
MKYQLKQATLPLNEEYEVIVCGGGPSGVTAAISAAREGAKTLLLESTGCLGGMSTNGLVNAWTPMSDGIRWVYSGLAEKIIRKGAEHMEHVDVENVRVIPIDFERLKQIYDQMVIESGADILFHSTVYSLEMKDERNVNVIIVGNKSGLTAYRAKVYIDCTGDADLYAFAGKEYQCGNEETGEYMAASLCFTVSNIDEEKFCHMEEQYGGKHRDTIKAILRDGKYDIPDDHYVAKQIGPNTYTFNAGHIWDVDATDPKSITAGYIEGRRLARELHDAFREYAPAWKESYLVQTSPCLGVRESRRIIGDYTFTAQDYLERASFPDEIFRGKYNIDVHSRKMSNTVKTYGRYGEGESYGVPYRCLCPRDLDNVLVAGRTISSERVANGTLRVMPCCLCEGEAVGMAAKFACEMDEPNIHTVDTQRLRKRLIEEGAYLPKLETDTF